MNIYIYVILSAVLGFALSTYVFKETQRKTLEHKAMFFLDVLFVAAFVYGVLSIHLGIQMVFPKGLVLGVLVPLNLYVGVVAIHYRNEKIERIAGICRRKEEKNVRNI